MLKIKTLNLSHLLNSEHIELMDFTCRAIAKHEILGERFPKAVAMFSATADRENSAFMKDNNHILSRQIQQAHDARILRFRSLNNSLKSVVLATDEEKATAALFLRQIVKQYGGASRIMKARVDSASAIFSSMTEDFLEVYPAKTDEAGVRGSVEALRQANDEYVALRSERTESVSKRQKAEMEDARKASDEEWRTLMDFISLNYHYDQDDRLLAFIKYMNTETDWYRTLIKLKTKNRNGNS